MDYSILVLLLSAIIGVSVAAPEERMLNTGTDITRKLTEHFKHPTASFGSCRHPSNCNLQRQNMLNFITEELKVLEVRAQSKGINNTSVEKIQFNTVIKVLGEHTNIQATNVILTLQGSVNKSDDKPLMILSNYDTAENSNFVNEGSGVAAMLVLAELLIQEIATKKLNLEHTLIFAFADAGYKKYNIRNAAEGITGAEQIVESWLPTFMTNRKSFQGAIILDNLMNFDENPNTQFVTDSGYDKSFPDAYRQMSENKFAANFIALVHRDDRLDNPLADLIEESWSSSKKQVKSEESPAAVQIDPLLIKFTFISEVIESLSVNEFLRSEQSAFWSHHVGAEKIWYPAVTLTDTRQFRECRSSLCNVDQMTSGKNLAFMKRIIATLKHAILNTQTDANGALPNVHASTFVLFSSIAVLLMTSKLF